MRFEVLLTLSLTHMCTGSFITINPLSCARKFRGPNGEGTFHFDAFTGRCIRGSNTEHLGNRWKTYEVHRANKDEGCVKWRSFLTVNENDAGSKTEKSRYKLNKEVRLGKKFRIRYRRNFNQSNYEMIFADSTYIYGGVICAASVQTSKDAIFKISQFLFCSDGYNQYVETPIFVASPQPGRVVQESPFEEMSWFVRENSCYYLGFQQNKDGIKISGSRDKMTRDVLKYGEVIMGVEWDFLSKFQSISFPNTVITKGNSVTAYFGEGLAFVYDYFRDRFIFGGRLRSPVLIPRLNNPVRC